MVRESANPTLTSPAKPEHARGRILIVDDEPGARDLLRDMLEDDGYQTVTAGDGEEAVEVYKAAEPDAVLLDVNMPRMDGLAALGQIRRFDPGARVAMLSGMSKQTTVKEAARAGARDFVVKPFDTDRVLGCIEELLSA